MEYLEYDGEGFVNRMSQLHGQAYNKLTVGAAIVRRAPGNNEKQILLLKRNEDEAYYPGVYEMPGGTYESEDVTIQRALRREVREETGLSVTRVVEALRDFTYTTQKPGSVAVKNVIQLSFVVGAKGVVTPNPEEHSKGDWFTVEEVMGLEMTNEMRAVVLEALGTESP